MATFPKLSYVCPIPWTEMRGDEKERFCSKCTRTVVNVSLLTEEERSALLSRVSPDQLCVAYYRRLSGEFVSAENPLKTSERRSIVQYGAAALCLGTLAATVKTVNVSPEANAALTHARKEIITAYHVAKNEVDYRTEQIIEKVSAAFFPKKDPLVTMYLGVVACPPPPPSPGGSSTPPPASE